MAKLEFTEAPEGLKGRPYRFYKDWLEVNFFKEICSYCLLKFPNSLQIEHYEPQAYAPRRVNDPANLLLGCPWCNSGKRDYHPQYRDRRRLPHESGGHSVIDVRDDDFADLFELKETGEILPRKGPQKIRAIFNITKLLRLDIPKYVEYRKKCFEYVAACENLIGVDDTRSKVALNILVAECAERHLFFKAFDVMLSNTLEGLINEYINSNKPKLFS